MLNEQWPVWFVTIALVVAAWIDGKQLKVPNWLTFPFIISGWIYSVAYFGWEGIGLSLLGTVIGLALLLPAYAIGGMGAGDVKMMAAVGAWIYVVDTVYAFCVSVIVGAIIAVVMIMTSGQAKKHWNQLVYIANEIMTVRNPETLAKIAAERKPSMRLLPYGIPLAIGTVMYFAWMRMLV